MNHTDRTRTEDPYEPVAASQPPTRAAAVPPQAPPPQAPQPPAPAPTASPSPALPQQAATPAVPAQPAHPALPDGQQQPPGTYVSAAAGRPAAGYATQGLPGSDTGPIPRAPAAATTGEMPSVEQAIALREQAPELYELWLKIAKEKAATANYVHRAPYEVPERLAQSGRPRALGALIIVLSFCGYLAWLGGPGPYIAGLIAILDLGVMFGMFFGLRPEHLADSPRPDRRRRASGRLARRQAARPAAEQERSRVSARQGLRDADSAPPATGSENDAVPGGSPEVDCR